MLLPERTHLISGPYNAPRCRVGQSVYCAVRGRVAILGMSDGRIPWPIGKRGRTKSLIVYLGLKRAIQRESNVAICHWWGITPQTVTKWRRALGVKRLTEGTQRLSVAYGSEPVAVEARANGLRKADLRERNKKISASKRGKPRPPHVKLKLRLANRGRKASPELRRRLSEAQRRRGARPPLAGRAWTVAEDAVILSCSASDAVRQVNRSLGAVYSRRRELKLAGADIEDGRSHK